MQTLKGSVNVAENGGEYGRMKIRTTQDSELFSYETQHTQTVWMSHGDEVVKLPEGFRPVATSEQVNQVGRLTADQQHSMQDCQQEPGSASGIGPSCLCQPLPSSPVPASEGRPWSSDMTLAWSEPGPHVLILTAATLMQGAIVAVECPSKHIYGLQYHPEVMHSDRGTPTLRHFLLQIAGMKPDWKIENILEEEMEKIRRTVRPGPDSASFSMHAC